MQAKRNLLETDNGDSLRTQLRKLSGVMPSQHVMYPTGLAGSCCLCGLATSRVPYMWIYLYAGRDVIGTLSRKYTMSACIARQH